MQKIIIKYAVDQASGESLYIEDVKGGLDCNCRCSGCGKPMIAVKGDIIERHFRHFEETDCKGGPETRLHLLTKEIILSASRMRLPNRTLFYSNPRAEKTLGKIRPDVTIISSNQEEVYIEIRVTNAKKEVQRQHFRDNQLKSVEINLSSISYDISYGELEDLVLNEPSNKIIFFWEVAPADVDTKEKRFSLHPLAIFTIIALMGYFAYRLLLPFFQKRNSRYSFKRRPYFIS